MVLGWRCSIGVLTVRYPGRKEEEELEVEDAERCRSVVVVGGGERGVL